MNSFFDFKSKNEFQKVILFFNLVIKLKNEKFSKFVLSLNQKTNYTFGARIELYFVFHFFGENGKLMKGLKIQSKNIEFCFSYSGKIIM